MAADRVEREVLIEAPIHVVWEVITKPEHVVGWFSDAAELDLRPGGAGVLTFNVKATDQGATYHLRFEAVEPPRRLAYRWVHPVDEEPGAGNSTLVEFILSEEGAGTRLRVVETGIELMPWPEAEKEEFADSHGKGWAQYLERLGAYASAAANRPVP
jgi:uncharacterized protein YndB with AHSA1/START domain